MEWNKKVRNYLSEFSCHRSARVDPIRTKEEKICNADLKASTRFTNKIFKSIPEHTVLECQFALTLFLRSREVSLRISEARKIFPLFHIFNHRMKMSFSIPHMRDIAGR
jgi:hypothetical protein